MAVVGTPPAEAVDIQEVVEGDNVFMNQPATPSSDGRRVFCPHCPELSTEALVRLFSSNSWV
jgi:hypothetical protein